MNPYAITRRFRHCLRLTDAQKSRLRYLRDEARGKIALSLAKPAMGGIHAELLWAAASARSCRRYGNARGILSITAKLRVSKERKG